MKVILKKSTAVEPFSFTFQSESGKTLLKSENYKVKGNAKKGILSVQRNCSNDKRFELKEAKNGKVFFNLKAANGQVVATSMMFATTEDRDAAIAELKASAAAAEIEEKV